MKTHSALTAASLALALAFGPPAQGAKKKRADPAAEAQLRPLIEKHLTIAHELTAGLLAWDAGDYALAAAHFEALLALKDLPDDVAAAIKPLAADARKKGGGKPVADQTGTPEPATPAPDEPEIEATPKPKGPVLVTVSGSVTGGGAGGPGGAVVTLHRSNGSTPRPTPLSNKPLIQRDKKFLPHVLAVPVGSRVSFRNQDDIFHNVFSISPAHAFDTGLKRAGDSETLAFDKPGVVELLCNIHASMNAWLVVVDTPWYAVADGAGAFRIKKVPAGDYDVEVWHENASQPARSKLTIGEESAALSLSVGGDKRTNPFPPDKYGKPRQQQLGY